ncbi:hypothetical protein [Nocardia gipuzkoensis]
MCHAQQRDAQQHRREDLVVTQVAHRHAGALLVVSPCPTADSPTAPFAHSAFGDHWALEHWTDNGWATEFGTFTLRVGTSVTDLRHIAYGD